MTYETLKFATAAMSDRKAVASEVAKQLGITTATLYYYVNGDGTVKARAQAIFDSRK